MSVSEISITSDYLWQQPQEQIRIQFFPLSSTEVVVNKIASIKGPVDLYCWYEGSRGLPKIGADFMKASIFEPLYALKPDVKLWLYSLRAWDFKKNITRMPITTPLGESINRINTVAIECIYSSAFFRFCTQISREASLYTFVNMELPKKRWLIELSENQCKNGTTVAKLFDNKTSLFDCIKDFDVCSAYSQIQYIEGYYLIRESVKNGLLRGQKKIDIAFVLPNDEDKYYLDFPNDINKMLQMEFGRDLVGIEIDISFQFFQYRESLSSRPYIDKRRHSLQVKPEEISYFFDYLSKPPQVPSDGLLLRDIIHNVNGWY